MVGPAGMIALLLALVWLALRRRFYFLLCLLPPVLVFVFSAMQSARYYAAPMSILVVCIGVALADFARLRGPAPRLLALAAVSLWAVTSWLPFAWTMNNAPIDLQLPPDERHEYIESDASGFGLAEVETALTNAQAQRVVGLLANCQSLRYELLNRIDVLCPTINPNGDTIPALEATLHQYQTAGSFAVLEALPYLPQAAPGEVVASVQAASGRPRLTIYRLLEP